MKEKSDTFFYLHLLLFRKAAILYFLYFYTSYTTFWGEKAKKLGKTQNHEVKENSHAFIREKFKSQILKLDMLFFKNFKSERKENKRCSLCITFLFQKGQGKKKPNKPNKTRQDASLI